jgi:hypothetical protein
LKSLPLPSAASRKPVFDKNTHFSLSYAAELGLFYNQPQDEHKITCVVVEARKNPFLGVVALCARMPTFLHIIPMLNINCPFPNKTSRLLSSSTLYTHTCDIFKQAKENIGILEIFYPLHR